MYSKARHIKLRPLTKRIPLTREDDEALVNIKEDGYSWEEIFDALPSRTPEAIQVRFYTKFTSGASRPRKNVDGYRGLLSTEVVSSVESIRRFWIQPISSANQNKIISYNLHMWFPLPEPYLYPFQKPYPLSGSLFLSSNSLYLPSMRFASSWFLLSCGFLNSASRPCGNQGRQSDAVKGGHIVLACEWRGPSLQHTLRQLSAKWWHPWANYLQDQSWQFVYYGD